MDKTLTEMADEVATAIYRTGGDGNLLALARIVSGIAAKLEGDQPAPDVLGRVLELADEMSRDFAERARIAVGEENYGAAADYRASANGVASFACRLRKEFNRD